MINLSEHQVMVFVPVLQTPHSLIIIKGTLNIVVLNVDLKILNGSLIGLLLLALIKKEVYSDLVECQLCGNSFANQGLGQHIKKSHDITIKEYYDKFKLVTKNKMCHCGNESIFKNLIVGYLTYCSNDCKFSDPNYRKKLSISHKGKRFSDKARRTNEKSGRWIKNTEKDLWLAYQLIVRHETKRHRKKLFSIWNGKCFYTDQVCITDPTEYNNVLYATLDHKISVHQGFKQKINPYYIASLDNLCICTRQYNSQKNVKSTNTSRDT